MPTDFLTRWNGVKGQFDRVFGEVFLLTARTGAADVDARRTSDPDRPATQFTGVWRDPHARVYPHSPGHADSGAERWGSDKPTIDFDVGALPYKVRQGDKVTRISNGASFAIEDVADDGFTRVTVALTSSRRA